MGTTFDATPVLNYLSLPPDYTPSPSATPLAFLTIHLRQLPPNLLSLFSVMLTPSQRTVIPMIRNRRQKYASTIPRELAWAEAHRRWPALWEGRERPGEEQAKDEKDWAERGLGFLGGKKGEVGRLGQLLGEYEEERGAELLRQARRDRFATMDSEMPEEEEEEDSEDGDVNDRGPYVEEQESPDQMKTSFERLITERFIYGGLDSIDYDSVDWDDKWDEVDERDSEERWFDEEEEADAPIEDFIT